LLRTTRASAPNPTTRPDSLGLPGRQHIEARKLFGIEGECALEDALIRTEQFPNLYVLPAGKPQGNPAELLDSARWRELCATVRESFRFVVIDTAPVASVTDFDLVEAVCDGVVLVARPDHSNRTLCLKALEKIPREKLVGILLNCMEDWWLQPSHGSYYYYALSSKK
jgi:Mrp family chromosome partitioning ATPase